VLARAKRIHAASDQIHSVLPQVWHRLLLQARDYVHFFVSGRSVPYGRLILALLGKQAEGRVDSKQAAKINCIANLLPDLFSSLIIHV